MVERTSVERTPDGYRVVAARRIAAPADAVWDLLVDTHRWPEWGPSVSDVDCEDRRIRTGSTGRVATVGGLRVPFTVTDCSEYRWTWRVGPVPATGHHVVPDGESCRAGIEVPLAAAPYTVVCARALRAIDRLATAG